MMEIKEAIKIIRDACDEWEYLKDTGDDWTDVHEARDLAISALEFRERYDKFWEEVKAAGMKGKETEIHHGGRVFRIREVAQQERETQEKPFPLVVGQPAEMFIDGKWEKGKIVAGYRFNDGVITIETEDGRRFWCGQDRTDIYRPYQEDE